MRRGQAAVEYLAIVGIVLLLAAPVLIDAQQSAGELQRASDVVVARTALDNAAEAARLVYSQGDPAQVTFTVTMPGNVIQSNVTDQYLHLRLRSPAGPIDLLSTLDFNVSGSIPTSRGQHALVAKAVNQTNVSITPS